MGTTEAEVRQVPSSWTTWSNGYTGQVLNNGSHSETFSLGSAVTAFGVFVEPAQYVTNSVTLTLSDGSTFSQNVAGYAGAAFFGWVMLAVAPLTVVPAPPARVTTVPVTFAVIEGTFL